MWATLGIVRYYAFFTMVFNWMLFLLWNRHNRQALFIWCQCSQITSHFNRSCENTFTIIWPSRKRVLFCCTKLLILCHELCLVPVTSVHENLNSLCRDEIRATAIIRSHLACAMQKCYEGFSAVCVSIKSIWNKWKERCGSSDNNNNGNAFFWMEKFRWLRSIHINRHLYMMYAVAITLKATTFFFVLPYRASLSYFAWFFVCSTCRIYTAKCCFTP